LGFEKNCMQSTTPRVADFFSLVKISHTIFALPFAILGFALGWMHAEAHEWWDFPLILLCMVTARNAAMGFNRWADRRYDRQNARTAQREIPAGKISGRAALAFVGANCVVFIMATYPLNASRLCFYLSPVALLVILGYSYTKRFTSLCHFVLGLGLGLAPVGAYLAVTGSFSAPIICLGLAVLCWTAGFDTIYALQDDQFDRQQGLHSLPVALGRRGALVLSVLLHVLCAGLIALVGYQLAMGGLYWLGAALFGGILVYQHLLVKPHDLSRVNLAFFTTNGIGSIVFCTLAIADLLA